MSLPAMLDKLEEERRDDDGVPATCHHGPRHVSQREAMPRVTKGGRMGRVLVDGDGVLRSSTTFKPDEMLGWVGRCQLPGVSSERAEAGEL